MPTELRSLCSSLSKKSLLRLFVASDSFISLPGSSDTDVLSIVLSERFLCSVAGAVWVWGGELGHSCVMPRDDQ